MPHFQLFTKTGAQGSPATPGITTNPPLYKSRLQEAKENKGQGNKRNQRNACLTYIAFCDFSKGVRKFASCREYFFSLDTEKGK